MKVEEARTRASERVLSLTRISSRFHVSWTFEKAFPRYNAL